MENDSVMLRGQIIEFTKTEFNLLFIKLQQLNVDHPGETLLAHICGEDALVRDRSVHVYTGKIRKKLGDYVDFIETKPGIGYRFNTQRVKHADPA